MNSLQKPTLVFAVLFLIFSGAAMAAPNITLYRYQNNDIKTIDPWISDDAKWPSGSKIALLVHGLPMLSHGDSRKNLTALGTHLSRKYKVVYAVEYPAGYHILDTAAALADIVNAKCSKGEKIDIFAHSMGGLVARTAIEYPKVLLGTKGIADKVSHLVTMGTPHHGFSAPEIDLFKTVMGKLPIEIGDMDPAGLFMVMLNLTNTQKPKVPCDYYSIVGLRSDRPEKFCRSRSGALAVILKKLQDKTFSVHDGLVDAASAGYDLKEVCHSFKKAQLNLNHDYIKAHQEVYDTIDNWMDKDKWFVTKQDTLFQNNFTGPQILLGKTRSEIESILGDVRLFRDIPAGDYSKKKLNKTSPHYFYSMKPVEECDAHVHFSPCRQVVDWKKTYNTVRFVSIKAAYDEKKLDKVLKVNQIVPPEILKTKPYGFFRYGEDNKVAVVWYIKQSTYVLIRSGSSDCPLYKTTRRKFKLNRYMINSNTFDLSKGYFCHFAYADMIIKMERVPSYLGNPDSYLLSMDGISQSCFSLYYFDK
ncbi:MAG: hypothetical protein UT28_C0001G0284 [Berkelbacteria bacterium GW2011_GWE1_39_12]|uniref:GPI inositol-deacylase PGAP1-like alpha/beta domain-containing protein n=1 Tax=Berkelbacteria bacterium GW2011_GWE1_39_12 TaxID=1618337 RepID=A0A0G4B3E2_9BACT|nr:MAG: hypothetical protein UT28_C0001G0284 [Berkelbacteria bacterium GW2011_GWE1_39_12]